MLGEKHAHRAGIVSITHATLRNLKVPDMREAPFTSSNTGVVKSYWNNFTGTDTVSLFDLREYSAKTFRLKAG
jgi:hypothetical protein